MCFKKLTKQVVKIEGMHCEHCAAKVKNELLKINNVKKVEIDLKNNVAFVSSKLKINDSELQKAIETAGFKFINVK